MTDSFANISLDHLLAYASALLLLGVIASKASSRLGIPSLILFMLIGVLAGSEGLGGIEFDDAGLVRGAGTLSLVLILFSGGLDSNWFSLRQVLKPGVLLATAGVVLTALLTAVAATYLIGLTPLQGLLFGAIVSSTDAAAVFGVLRARSMRLKGNLTPLLELESGTNDPMAVFLTVGISALILHPAQDPLNLFSSLILQSLVGAICGYALGRALVWVVNRARLSYTGLYPVLTLSGAVGGYALTQILGGSGFLAVYMAGVVMSNRSFINKVTIRHFHEAVAWLFQIVMFLSLGLLVLPSQLVPVASAGFILSIFLILVARPAAVFVSLLFYPAFSWRKKTFISWVGLRGAIPIILATIPLTSGVPEAMTMFNLVFFVVVASVLIQGTTIPLVARWLGVLAEGEADPYDRRAASSTLDLTVGEDSKAVGQRVVDLNLPKTALIALLTREGSSFIPRGETVIQPGDHLLLATRQNDMHELRKIFASPDLDQEF